MATTLTEVREQTRARYPDESGYVEREGVRTYYEAYGDGEPTLLFIPPWQIVHSRIWKMQIPYFARHFRGVTFDMRGNGRSDRPPTAEAYADEEVIADAIAVMDATATERAVLVGFSYSGKLALMLAADYPERALGMVVIGPAVPLGEALPARSVYSFDDELETDEGWAKHNRHYWLRDYPGFVEFFISEMFPEPHSTKAIEDGIGWGLETDAETLILTHDAPSMSEVEEAEAMCRKVQCPVLVIHGEEDRQVSYTRGIAVAEATGGQLVLLEGSGHAPHVRDPVKVNLLIREFVDSIRRRSR
jgi:pimeloyl-ACP methyl ester carboxylesterase